MFSSPRPARSRSLASFVSVAAFITASVAAASIALALCTSSCARGGNDTQGPATDDGAPVGAAIGCAADASPAATATLTQPVAGATVSSPAASSPAVSSPTASAAGAGGGDDAQSPDDLGADASAPTPATVVPTTTTPTPANPAPGTTAPVVATASAPAPGELAITEVMLAPSGTEPESEWFEIYNLSASPKLLSGLILQDGFGDTHTIASAPAVIAPALTYVVLVRDRVMAAQTLVPAAAIVYEYGTGLTDDEGIELDSGGAGDLSLWAAGASGETLLADVPYGMWNGDSVGQSIELWTPQSIANDPQSWCVAETPWAPGSDDGTPGAPSDCGP